MTYSDSTHLLLAGNLHDVPRILMVLEHSLPCVYGQIYLEVDDADASVARGLLLSELPAGISLTLLRHSKDERSQPGEMLAEALAGWAAEWAGEPVDEWVMGEAPAEAETIAMWVGFAESRAVNSACRSLARRLDRTPVHLRRD